MTFIHSTEMVTPTFFTKLHLQLLSFIYIKCVLKPSPSSVCLLQLLKNNVLIHKYWTTCKINLFFSQIVCILNILYTYQNVQNSNDIDIMFLYETMIAK